jgi:acetoin:2,6-dichlorophenolindophenol oxidoreductase subunit alpha
MSPQEVETGLEDLRGMARIREFETRVARQFREGQIPGFVHVSIGQEAVARGVCSVLREDDYITTTHRGHGHCIAKGADPNSMMAELFGRASGTCGGKGGSMHIADPRFGILGANGIVGAGMPIAVGAGLAARTRREDKVAVAFAGEGAVHSGSFHEALSLAVLWEVPVVFVIENNQFSEFTRSEEIWRGASLVKRALDYGVHGSERVDGNDVGAVRDAATRAIDAARDGLGPSLVEALTYRVHGHYEGDATPYRDDAEYSEWLDRDPVELVARSLREDGHGERVEAILAAAGAEMDRAVELGLADDYPPSTSLLEDVYA